MSAAVLPSLTLTEVEALVHFIAERRELWKRVAESFGVEEPDRLAVELIQAHTKAVRKHFRKEAA